MAEALPVNEEVPFPGLEALGQGPATRVLIIGHSQVSGLDLEGPPQMGNHPMLQGPLLYRQISVAGATMDTLLDQTVAEQIWNFFPHIVFLFIGSNDLDVTRELDFREDCVKGLRKLLKQIHKLSHAKIYFISAEPRARPRNVTPAEYRKRKNRFNQLVKTKVTVAIVFCPYNIQECIFDGVHFNAQARHRLQELVWLQAETYAVLNGW